MKQLSITATVVLVTLLAIRPAIADNTVYDHNVIVNGDAEAGDGLPGRGIVPGWTTDANTAVGIISVQYNYQFPSGNYPDSGVPGPRHRGKNFFAGGTNSAESVATQPIDISAILADVDAHSVHYALEGWLGGNGNKADYATLTAQFFDAGGTLLGNGVIGPVTVEQRRGVTGMYYRIATGFLPVGTRRIVVMMDAKRFSGTNNDGYFDALSLVLRKQGAH
jgi:hypothetical protein